MSTITTKTPGQTTTTVPGETRILVPNASWRLYQAFVENLPDRSPIRTAFDGRDMEITVKGPVHDHFCGLLDMFIMSVAGALGIRIKPLRETTWIRPEIERGIEGDNCYYLDLAKIAASLRLLGHGVNDVKDYPNPDLVIEVDISAPEMDRLGIYAAMCVAEVWIFDGRDLTIHLLGADGRYQVVDRSGFLPIHARDVGPWLVEQDVSDYDAWVQRVRAWAAKELSGS
jgi:Uma2 family endonuclease